MSEYGPPPPDPNQPNPYGQPEPYGQPGYAYSGAPANYAHWGKRVGALIIDVVLTMVAAIPLWIGYALIFAGAETTTTDGTVMIENNDIGAAPILLIVLGFATYFGFFIWNTVLKQGKTGYSIGKGVLGIKLIGMQTGQPIGGGMTFVRQLAHIVDSLPCYLGYLWPLWDDKNQTFADKIVSTVVIDQPKG
ncbi:hypothetical protein GCM10027020_29370 [Nocardioides salsibiostraticola]